MQRSPKKAVHRKKPQTVTAVSDFRYGNELKKYDATVPTRVSALAHLGLTIAQIAHALGVTEHTVENWIQLRPGVKEAYEQGKWMHDHGVALTLQQRALGYEYVETKTTTGVDATGRPYERTVTTTKHVPGDVTAQIFFLKNRQSERWRDVYRDIGTTNILNVDMSKNLDLSALSDEEKALLRSAAIKNIADMNGIDRE